MFESMAVPAEEPDDGFGVEAWRLAAWAVEDALRADEPVVAPHWSELADLDSEYVPSAEVLLADAVGLGTGVGLVGSLVGVDIGGLSADDAITYLQQVDRFVAFAAGFEVRARAAVTERVVEHFRTVEDVSEFVTAEQAAAAELAAATRLSPRTSDARVQESVDLTGPWRPLLDPLLAGEVSLDHVRAIGRELRKAPGYGDPAQDAAYAKACSEVLAVVVPYARSHTPGQCAQRVRALVIAADPAGARRRRQQVAESEHGVYLGPGSEPGTCELTAVLPLAHGKAVYNAIDSLARDPRFETADGCVTLGQRKVAALVALMLGDPGTIAVIDGPVYEAKIRAHVDVVVPLATMLGASKDATTPTDIDRLQGGTVGSEPVGADVVLDLLAECDPSSTLRRLVTDQNGAVLDLGRSRYAISDAQRHLIARRDRWCRHPGCTRPAAKCEIDHATAWNDGGTTDIPNLGALCKYHHQLKTHTHWQITKSARDGSCTWRSPLGRIYHHHPPDPLPPRPDPDDDPPPF